MTDGADPRVTAGSHDVADFRLVSGATLPVRVAYITQGRLDATGSNAVLVTHGFTSSHRFILRGSKAAEGAWCDLVGPGLALDTDRFFVVSANVLGSAYGTTGPASIDPGTGRPYGSDFPAIEFADIVGLQRQLLDALGVARLHAVVGVSMGGYQALQWAVQFPDQVHKVVVALSALASPAKGQDLRKLFEADPAWNGGHPAPGAMASTLQRLRFDTLQRYGMDAWLADQGCPAADRVQQMQALAATWSREFDANALLTLRAACDRFDVQPALGRVRAELLLVLSTTDLLFPAATGAGIMAALQAHGVRASFHAIDSAYGHLASGLDWQKWSGVLQDFLSADR